MLQGIRVLFVDDQDGSRQLASHVLEQSHARYALADNGVEALALLEGATFDVVVIDMIMPEKEGFATISEIRQRWPETRIIAISGGGEMGAFDLLKMARIVGADETQSKPLDYKRLVEIIRDLAQISSAQ